MKKGRPEEAGSVIALLRAVTGEQHCRLERGFDAVSALADPLRRPETICRYAALYRSAHAALEAKLRSIEGLRFPLRLRAWKSPCSATAAQSRHSPFPAPADRWEALGSLYVVEGSTLGGRLILRELYRRGIEDPALSFLDPYGQDSGRMWRDLTAILEREGSRGVAQTESVCRGAVNAFAYAEAILCGNAGENG